jgi:adenosylhomocysteine nucleosidase
MIAIIAAMDKEIKTLLDNMETTLIETFADKIFYIGTLKGKNVVVAKSGIGKVNAAITTAALCLNYEIDFIINTGVAGGLFPVNTGEIVLSEGVVYSDVDVSNIDKDITFGQMPGDPFIVMADEDLISLAKTLFDALKLPYRLGLIASGDQFVTDSRTLLPIQNSVGNILAVEMESMGVAMTSYKFGRPFIVIRGVSDVIDDTLQVQMYENTVADIADMTAKFVIQFVEGYHWIKSS